MRYHFGPFILDTDKVVLIDGNDLVPLTRKRYDILLMLVTNAGRLLTKNEILQQVWPDQDVEEGNLSNQIHSIRRLLRDDPRNPTVIITVQGFGYRFQPEVTVVNDSVTPPVAEVNTGRLDEMSRNKQVWLIVAGLLAILLIAAIIGVLVLVRSQRLASWEMPLPIQLTAYPGVEQYPALSPDGHFIAYTWDGGDINNRDIYIQQTNGGKQVRVTTNPGADLQPVWSPDGLQLAFQRVDEKAGSPNHLIIVPTLGGPERELARVDGGLDWSPDGKKLVVTGLAGAGGGMGLFIISVDGFVRQQITRQDAAGTIYDSTPRFSPDGRSVAFLRSKGNEDNHVTIVDLASGQIRELTKERYLIQPGSLSWDTDGTKILFISRQGGPGQLYQVGLNGDKATPVSSVPVPITSFSIERNGALLAYTSEVIDFRIEVYNLSSQKDQPCVINSTRADNFPQLSPDGSQLVFGSDRSGWDEIYQVNADCSKVRQLTNFRELGVGSPRWSPDGTRIVFDRRNRGDSDIYTIDLNGAQTARVSDSIGSNVLPFWAPGGEWIYYSSNRAIPRTAYQTWKVRVSGGEAVIVTPPGTNTRTCPILSPDGKTLYHSRNNRLVQFDLATGTESEVVELANLYVDRNWDIGKDAIYFFHYEAGPASSIERLDLRTRRITTLGRVVEATANGLYSLTVARDERRYAVSRPYVGLSDIMLVKNWR